MSKLQAFYENLERLRKPKSDDPYDDRTTHCYLAYVHNDLEHKFEVRGWGKIRDGVLHISAVNWTVCAGAVSIEMNEDIVDGYRICTKYQTENLKK